MFGPEGLFSNPAIVNVPPPVDANFFKINTPEINIPKVNLQSLKLNGIMLRDFQPFNTWKVDENGRKWDDCPEPAELIDQTTGRKYLNESKGIVRFKCFLVTLGTPIVHTVASLINIAYRVALLVSFSHFWNIQDKQYTFKARLQDYGYDLLRIIATPIALVGLQLSSLYGVFSPYNGRKVYATFERALYGQGIHPGAGILAPCFQPDAAKHLLGGDIGSKDTW